MAEIQTSVTLDLKNVEQIIKDAREMLMMAQEALMPLVKIADAYDENNLDDEARKYWGAHQEHENTTPPEQIELYTGRGGGTLLTLAHCFAARDLVRGVAAPRVRNNSVNEDGVDELSY